VAANIARYGKSLEELEFSSVIPRFQTHLPSIATIPTVGSIPCIPRLLPNLQQIGGDLDLTLYFAFRHSARRIFKLNASKLDTLFDLATNDRDSIQKKMDEIAETKLDGNAADEDDDGDESGGGDSDGDGEGSNEGSDKDEDEGNDDASDGEEDEAGENSEEITFDGFRVRNGDLVLSPDTEFWSALCC